MLRIAVVGATGAVGRECLTLISQGVIPADRVVPIASASSAGIDLADKFGLELPMDPVTTLDDADFADIDVAVFCAGAELSTRAAETVAAQGVLVIDNSSAFRRRPDVPLVVPTVNPEQLAHRPGSGIVANPNCSTIQLVRVLQPLHRLAGLEQVIVSTYQAASGGGNRGLAELSDATAARLAEPNSPPEPAGRFGQPLAFNLVPEIGLTDDSGYSNEERKLAYEPKKILDLPELRISATAVRVPVLDCHSEAVHVRTRTPVSAEAVEHALAAAPGLRTYPRGEAPRYPMPRIVAMSDDDRAQVHVGRVRTDPDDERALWLWVVADNLWVGAALNALDIAVLAMKNGWLR